MAKTRPICKDSLFEKIFIIYVICMVYLNYVVFSYKNKSDSAIIEDKLQIQVYSYENKKNILIWYTAEHFPFYRHVVNQSNIFTKTKCLHSNCHLTYDRAYLHNVTNFDAIVFHGRGLDEYDLPLKRSYHQKYLFFNVESPYYFPVCSKRFDGYFNWTSTYRLDSDIPYPYIQITDRFGTIIGPKDDIKWIKYNNSEVDKREMDEIWGKKISAAFWLGSHCRTASRRESKISELRAVLEKVGLRIDLYGYCGRPLANSEEYEVERYYFQLAFENSASEDYVTEKLTKAWKYSAIPVVYGGANYTRFLPPGSYLDASKLSAIDLARRMLSIIENKKLFIEYYEWKLSYSYKNPINENFCSFCAALHNETMMKRSSHKNFTKWWNSVADSNCERLTLQKFNELIYTKIGTVFFIMSNMVLLLYICKIKPVKNVYAIVKMLFFIRLKRGGSRFDNDSEPLILLENCG